MKREQRMNNKIDVYNYFLFILWFIFVIFLLIFGQESPCCFYMGVEFVFFVTTWIPFINNCSKCPLLTI